MLAGLGDRVVRDDELSCLAEPPPRPSRRAHVPVLRNKAFGSPPSDGGEGAGDGAKGAK
jgi:hypothetical protein